ncbi:sensor histidine kinase [Alicyclobacillus acidoterrestris]|uniref:sensor histidine kinase n=1 Tax=Alicyclobacillus acidoterrestris TaxID=1450 RepID=UPI003F5397C5
MNQSTNHQAFAVVFRRVALIVLAVCAMWQPMTRGSEVIQFASIGECVISCIAILVMMSYRLSESLRTSIGIGVVIVHVLISIFIQRDVTGTGMLFFIVGIAGSRLNAPYTWWTAAVAMVGFLTLLVFIKPFGNMSIAYIGYTMGFLATFIATRNGHLRRQARAAQEQYFLRLERAHKALQAAHRDLQEVSIGSMQLAVVQERNRIARDIHDSVGHALTSLVVQLQALQYRVRQDVDGAEQQIKDLITVARHSLEEVRQSVREVADASPITGMQAISALVDGVKANSGLSITFHASAELDDLPLETGVIVYRVLQEALTNVVRHSGAQQVKIRIERMEQSNQTYIRLHVTDDGQMKPGFPLQEGFGMHGMRSRCEDHGGTFNWSAVYPHGLEIEAILPWSKPIDEENQI